MSLSRRLFLQRLGGSALALPLLQLPGGARAQGLSYPKRLLIFYTPNGTKKELWSPGQHKDTVDSTHFQLGPILSPLTPFKDRLIVMDGIHLAAAKEGAGGPHQRGMASLLSGAVITEGDFVGGDGRRAGWGGGISIDQYVARKQQAATSLSSIELGIRVRENVPRGRIIYGGVEQPIPPENDPIRAYARMFGQPTMSPEETARMLLRRRSVLDAVLGDFNTTRARLTRVDQEKLDRHANALRDLERRLANMTSNPGGCRPPKPRDGMDLMGESEYRDLLRTQIDLMVKAFACDVTRVGSIQCSTSVNALRFTFMNMRDHDGHALSHAGNTNDELQSQWERMLSWYSQQFTYLLEQLDSVAEGDGTLLDNTVVLWVNEISRGNTHSHDDMPFILAGSAGGALKTGQWLEFDGVPHNNLLLSVLHALDIDDPVFGDPRFCSGPLPGLT